MAIFSSVVSFLILLNAFLWGVTSGQAQTDATQASVSVDLISEFEGYSGGTSSYVGIRFALEPHWHVYWKNPGSSGYGISVEWDLPEGVAVGALEWPTPKQFTFDGFTNYGYSDEVTLLAPLTIDKGVNTELLEIRATVSWLACKTACVPGSASLSLSLPRASESTLNARSVAAFQKARASLPVMLLPWILGVSETEEGMRIEIPEVNLESPYFFANEAWVVDADAPQVIEEVGTATFLEVQLLEPLSKDGIKGVLKMGARAWEVELMPQVKASVTEAGNLQVETVEGWEARLLNTGLGGWLVLAFLGGLILNIMPCVLPVLSLKVFSLLKHAGQTRRDSIAYGFAYTLGVVMSFVALAAILFILRGLGERVGWGFQLQNPGFVVGLTLLLFLFGLNLVGVFEMGLGLVGADSKVARRNDLLGSFGTGILAAVVGAPCVGPLVGGASGVALQAEPWVGISVFGMMGFGMATPFLLLAIFPKLASYLPKPGPWMETFKHAMGFILFAVVLFLLWVVGQSGGTDGMLALAIALLIASVGAWLYGRWGAVSKPKKVRRIATLVTLVVIGLSFWQGARSVSLAYESIRVSSTSGTAENEWQAWSKAAVAEHLATGRPVFVDFTASWCLICQVNKRTVLRTASIETLFKEYDVAALQADWTTQDATITDALESYGRSGVPLYLLHLPNGETDILPQNLTKATVREAVESKLTRGR